MKAIRLVPPFLLALAAIAYLRSGPEYLLLTIPVVSILSFRFISGPWTWKVVGTSFIISLLGSSLLLFLGLPEFKSWGVLSFMFFSTGALASYLDWLGVLETKGGKSNPNAPIGSPDKAKTRHGGVKR